MTGEVISLEGRIPAMSPEAIGRVYGLEEELRKLPPVMFATHHVLHGGMYSRTILIPAGVVITGALVKVPTIVAISGHARVFVGEEAFDVEGYEILAASAGRKQAFYAHDDTYLTMVFTTSARTVEQAEQEFTDEAEFLVSRHPNAVNVVVMGD